MNVGHECVGIRRDDRKSADPLTESRVLPIFLCTGDTERCTIFHGDRIRLFCFLAFDCLPLEKAVDRHDATAPAVRVAKSWQVPHGLAFGIDGFAATLRVSTPIGDQAPTQWVERHISRLVIAADDQQFLAGRGVPPAWIIVHATVAYVHAIDDGIPKRSAALDYPPTHEADIVMAVYARPRSQDAKQLRTAYKRS
jgi:hypothetical protein